MPAQMVFRLLRPTGGVNGEETVAGLVPHTNEKVTACSGTLKLASKLRMLPALARPQPAVAVGAKITFRFPYH